MVVQALFLTIFLSFCFVDANNCSLIAKTGSKLIDKKNKFKLWPGLMSKYDIENGETLIGLEEVSLYFYRIDCVLVSCFMYSRH